MADCEVAVVGNIDNLVLMSLGFLSFTTVHPTGIAVISAKNEHVSNFCLKF